MIPAVKKWFSKLTRNHSENESSSIHSHVQGVEDALDSVESSLNSIESWEAPKASEIVEYLVTAGGKRLRPTLVFLTYDAAGGENPQVPKPYAVAAELLHTATLLHDDVIDDSETRRGQPTAKEKYGNRQAILGGDFLVADIIEDLLKRDYPEIVRYLAFTMRRLVEGEFLQEEYAGRFDLGEEQYFQVVELKTAALFAYSAWAGSYLSKENEELSNRFARYAESLGIAFQIVDDVLDFEAEQTGKDALDDLRKGNVNYPLILLLDRSPSLREQLHREFDEKGSFADSTQRSVLDALQEENVLSEAREEAGTYANKARAALEGVPENPRTDLLLEIPRFVTERLS